MGERTRKVNQYFACVLMGTKERGESSLHSLLIPWLCLSPLLSGRGSFCMEIQVSMFPVKNSQLAGAGKGPFLRPWRTIVRNHTVRINHTELDGSIALLLCKTVSYAQVSFQTCSWDPALLSLSQLPTDWGHLPMANQSIFSKMMRSKSSFPFIVVYKKAFWQVQPVTSLEG